MASLLDVVISIPVQVSSSKFYKLSQILHCVMKFVKNKRIMYVMELKHQY